MAETDAVLEIDRKDHGLTRVAESPLPALEPGTLRFRVERFALTSNNVTYAAFGDLLGYWDFFPSGSAWGRVPAMGWGEVVESRHPEVPAGGRYYGWFPMARWVDMAVSATPTGVRDEGEHRAAHSPVYRSYLASDRDPLYEAGEEAEDRHALLRGLFVTGFLAADFFAGHEDYGAGRALVISASSKTAIAFARCAAARGLEVVGLTSPRNRDFATQLGCYERVLVYDEIERLPDDGDAVCVDMAGDGDLLARVHARLGARLRHSMAIGRSHHESPPPPAELPGPSPELFFAPTWMSRRSEELGPEGTRRWLGDALAAFVADSRSWLGLEHARGPDAVQAAWEAVRSGSLPPSRGQIASLWDAGAGGA